MKTLVIAEKPSVSRDLARLLGCRKKRDGYLEGEEYLVTWAVGHMVTLKMPEEYNPSFKKWKLEDLPIMPERMLLKPLQQTLEQYAKVKGLMHSPDVAEIVCATDAGREGELIFRYIYTLAGCTKPVKRLWINSLTDGAIRKGFAALKPAGHYDNLYEAARCRSEADWLVGLNATRAFTVRHGALLSVGRVQTPTLALLVNREKEIQNFEPRDYWEVVVEYLEGFQGKWEGDGEGRTFNKPRAEAVREKVAHKTGEVKDVKKEEKKERPPLLYDLTELQRDGNRRFGFGAQQVLDLAQRLYEKKLITYPRTDSRYLGRDIDTLEIIAQLKGYEQYTEQVIREGWFLQTRNINDSKVTDHHAIIPTGENGKPGGDEGKVYDLVVRRFIAGFFPDHLFKVTTVNVEIEEETFISKGKVVTQQGWKELYDLPSGKNQDGDGEGHEGDKEEVAEEQKLPDLAKGDFLTVQESKVLQKQTRPPARYTEGSILSAMENAGKMIDDEALRERMKERGLGTPATRAAIIERLLHVGYIRRRGKSLVPLEKGMALVEMMPESLKSPELTGNWEKMLYDIQKGRLQPDQYIAEIKKYTGEIVEEAAKSISKNSSLALGNKKVFGTCPLCKEPVVENSKGYGCSAWKATGCDFFLGKKIAGKKLTEKQVRQLLEEGQTGKIKGFISKKGTKFEAVLKITDGNVRFVFD